MIEFDGGLPIQYSGTLCEVANRFGYNLWVQGDRGDIWTNRRWIWWRPKGQRFFRPVKLVSVPKGDEQRYPKAGTVSLLNQFRDAVIREKNSEDQRVSSLLVNIVSCFYPFRCCILAKYYHGNGQGTAQSLK